MHLVFLNQYYPPDAAPTGVMLEAVVERLADAGHEVTVLCAHGGYADAAGRREEETPRSPISEARSTIRVVRIGATNFGRGTFIGKLLDYGSYYAGVAWRLMWLRSQPQRIVALTTPPYLSVLARVMSKLRGADHAHWVMDVYPDVMVAHGMLGEGKWLHCLLSKLAQWGFGGERSAAVLTLGPDMAERIEGLIGGMVAAGCDRRCECEAGAMTCSMGTDAHGAPLTSTPDEVGRMRESEPAVHWIPLWGDFTGPVREGGEASEETISARLVRRQRGWRDEELVVMYSGNMGLGHRFGEILEVVRRMAGLSERDQDGLPRRPGIPDGGTTETRFVFFGQGKRRGELEEFMRTFPCSLIELHDYAPREGLFHHLQSADVHLVSLDPAWTGTMLPSKLQGIFAVSRPVIFIGDENSSIARWVRESGGGWVVAPHAVESLAAVIEEARDPEVRDQRGKAALAFARKCFDRETNVHQAAEVLARPRACLHSECMG